MTSVPGSGQASDNYWSGGHGVSSDGQPQGYAYAPVTDQIQTQAFPSIAQNAQSARPLRRTASGRGLNGQKVAALPEYSRRIAEQNPLPKVVFDYLGQRNVLRSHDSEDVAKRMAIVHGANLLIKFSDGKTKGSVFSSYKSADLINAQLADAGLDFTVGRDAIAKLARSYKDGQSG